MTVSFPTRILFGVLFLTAMGCVTMTGRAAEHTKDSLDTVKKAVTDNKAVLLDVREKAEWDRGHLPRCQVPGAERTAPRRQGRRVGPRTAQGQGDLLPLRVGRALFRAADILKKNGYDVRPLKSGYKDLLKAGFTPAAK